MNSSPCPFKSRFDLLYSVPAPVVPGLSLLQDRLVHSHRATCVPVLPHSWATAPSEMHLFLHGLTYSNTPLSCDPALTHPHSWLESLCRCPCSVLGLFLMHNHWCFKVNLLYHGLLHSHRWFAIYLLLLQYGLTLGPFRHIPAVAHNNHSTGAFRYACSGLDLSMATDALGSPAHTWSHP